MICLVCGGQVRDIQHRVPEITGARSSFYFSGWSCFSLSDRGSPNNGPARQDDSPTPFQTLPPASKRPSRKRALPPVPPVHLPATTTPPPIPTHPTAQSGNPRHSPTTAQLKTKPSTIRWSRSDGSTDLNQSRKYAKSVPSSACTSYSCLTHYSTTTTTIQGCIADVSVASTISVFPAFHEMGFRQALFH